MTSETGNTSPPARSFPSVNILGVRVDAVDRQSILRIAATWAQQEQPRSIAYANAHCLNLAYKDEVYRTILNASDMLTADGIGVVWAGRVLTGIKLHKVTSRTFIDDLCEIAASLNLKLYILAGAPGVAEKAVKIIQARHAGLVIAGYCDGFFSLKNETGVLDEINTSRPDMLLVGMGAPRQEKWIQRNRALIHVPLCWGLGAVFDYVAGIEPVVPGWLDQIGLEWLWRLMVNPRDKWRRYLIGNPLFFIRVLLQKYSVKYK